MVGKQVQIYNLICIWNNVASVTAVRSMSLQCLCITLTMQGGTAICVYVTQQ